MRHSARKKQLRRRCLLAGFFGAAGTAFLVLTAGGGEPPQSRYLGENSGEEIFSESGQEVQPSGPSAEETEILEKLTALAESDSRIRQVLENAGQYPEDILKAVAENPETAGFALGYPAKKNRTPASTIGPVEKGQIPELIQWDERWGYVWYGDGVLGVTGCGPTALSMVAAGLTGDDSVTPAEVAAYAEKNGYYVRDVGTGWDLMTEGCRAFGVSGQELPLQKNVIFDRLEEGSPVICSMKPGDFTSQGHFIVLAGVEQGKIRVRDSNSPSRSGRLWEYETLEPQINNLWAFVLL